MSYVLPKELQTKKLSSLPDDLKKIAEELLVSKFDIKEEVVPKRDTPFRGDRYAQEYGTGQYDIYGEPSMGDRYYRGYPRTDARAWGSNTNLSYVERSLVISLQACWNLKRRMDQKTRRTYSSKFIMGYEEFVEITRDIRFAECITNRSDTGIREIFGIPIELNGRKTHCIDLMFEY